MADLPNPDAALELPAMAGSADRRRPGRAERAHPALIALLRKPHGIEDTPAASPVAPAEDQAAAAAEGQLTWSSTRDEIGPARGIALAVLLTLPFWCAVAFALWVW